MFDILQDLISKMQELLHSSGARYFHVVHIGTVRLAVCIVSYLQNGSNKICLVFHSNKLAVGGSDVH